MNRRRRQPPSFRSARRRPLFEQLDERAMLAVATVVDHGPAANRVDLVFVGDGYKTDELATSFAGHVDATIEHFFESGDEPYSRYRKFFNVHRVDAASKESGADHPLHSRYVDTAFDASYDCVAGQDICVSSSKVTAAVSAELSAAGLESDATLVAVNDSQFGGYAAGFAVYSAQHSQASEIALHELGHALHHLADEYAGSGTYAGAEPSAVNITTSATGAKWGRWIGYRQPGIGEIAAYEGADKFDTGLFRPSQNSKMRSLGQPFDAVSREKMILDLYDHVDPMDDWLEHRETVVGTTPELWVRPIDSDVLNIEWRVDGALIGGATDTSFRPADFGFPSGQYSVTARVFDPTEWVRASRAALEQTITWNVIQTDEPTVFVRLDRFETDEQQGPGAVSGNVQRMNDDLSQDIVVSLISSDPSEAVVPATVTIPAGQSSVAFAVDAIDDRRIDGSQTVVIEPQVAGFHSVTQAITVRDHEPLEIQLDPTTVLESAGSEAVTGTVTRLTDDIADPLYVFLEIDDATEIQVSGQGDGSGSTGGLSSSTRPFVVIDAGQASAEFHLDAVDDDQLDGTQAVTILAAAAGLVDATVSLAVQDDEPFLSIAWIEDSVSENAQKTSATVTRHTADLANACTVTLTSSDASEIMAPRTVEIPAGEQGVTFELSVVDDLVFDGAQGVTLAAASHGFFPAASVIDVLDHETWQNPLSPLDVNADGLITPRDALIVINLLNEFGSHALAPPDPTRIAFLDTDGNGYVTPLDPLLVINMLNFV